MAVAMHMGYRVDDLPFRVHGEEGEVTLSQLIEMDDVFASVEDSGIEICHVEVARWSNERERWERYAFAWMLHVELRDTVNDGDVLGECDSAMIIARLINRSRECPSFIPSLPEWAG